MDEKQFIDPASYDGIHVVVLASGADTRNQYAIVSMTFAPFAQGAPMHSHLQYSEGCYVVSGTLAIAKASELLTMSAGAATLIPAGVSHTCWNPTASPTTVLVVYKPGLTEEEARSLALGASGFT